MIPRRQNRTTSKNRTSVPSRPSASLLWIETLINNSSSLSLSLLSHRQSSSLSLELSERKGGQQNCDTEPRCWFGSHPRGCIGWSVNAELCRSAHNSTSNANNRSPPRGCRQAHRRLPADMELLWRGRTELYLRSQRREVVARTQRNQS